MLKRKRKEKIVELPCRDIYPNPSQPRKSFPTEAMARLADSIARYGVLEPICVRQAGEKYELILGERRLRACKMLERETIPCRVMETSLRQGAEMALIENCMREDLTVFEEAQALDYLMKNFRFTQEELAQKLGQSQSCIANKLRILRLSGEEKALICENDLTERHARALLKIQDPKLRLFALQFIIQKQYNVRQAEAFISTLLDHPDEFMISLHPREKKTPHPVRKLIVKDVRLFINSVDKAIFCIQEAGYSVQAEKKEAEEYISYQIRIPKYIEKR